MPMLEKITHPRGGTDARSGDAPGGGASPRAVLIVMCVGYFLVLLDVTIVNVGLPTIGAGLHANVSDVQWPAGRSGSQSPAHPPTTTPSWRGFTPSPIAAAGPYLAVAIVGLVLIPGRRAPR